MREGKAMPGAAGLGAAGLLCAALAVLPPAGAQAAEARLSAGVVRTLASEDGRYGGCMAQLSESVAEATGLDCPGRWVAFSCSGEHASKAEARRLFDSAQLAFVAGRRAVVWVDDGRKHGGYCFAPTHRRARGMSRAQPVDGKRPPLREAAMPPIECSRCQGRWNAG